MTDTSLAEGANNEQRWSQWRMTFLERLSIPYWAVVLGIVLLGAISIGLEAMLKLRMPGGWGPEKQQGLIEGIVMLLVVLYIISHLRLIKQVAVKSLVQLRSSVQISDATYERYAARLICSKGWIELLLLLAAALTVVFFLLPSEGVGRLPHGQPEEILAIAAILAYYVVGFTSLLNLVYIAIRNARVLGELARQPLTVNVFDPVGLLPFGRLSLAQSLAFVGVFLIPLIIVGAPKQGGWLVIGLSVLSLALLFVPLWGVHQQIIKAREAVLSGLCGDLLEVQGRLLAERSTELAQLQALAARTEALMTFRKHILSGPSWPFRDFGTVIRAVAAAASPLIYLVLNQLIQTYLFPLLTR